MHFYLWVIYILLMQVREAQLDQYNYILVVGQQELDSDAVNVRTRDNEVQGTLKISELLAKFATESQEMK